MVRFLQFIIIYLVEICLKTALWLECYKIKKEEKVGEEK